MKTIGLIGGMSYESTIEYYRIINELVNERLGGLKSAKMLIESYDFSIIENLQTKNDWDNLGLILADSAKKLETLGADFIAIATNTMHYVAPFVKKNIKIPLIHIVQATLNQIRRKNHDCVCLLGTKYTMSLPFYKEILEDNNIKVIIPKDEDKEVINDIIYNELCVGIINKESKDKLLSIIETCSKLGASAAVLGCTELPNIIKKAPIDLIDTTKAHCIEIVDRILA